MIQFAIPQGVSEATLLKWREHASRNLGAYVTRPDDGRPPESGSKGLNRLERNIFGVEVPEGHELYEFDTSQRYYGEGYARGHWPDIRMQLMWLLSKFPRVWYGHDCGETLQAVDHALILKLDAYYLEHGNDPYQLDKGGVDDPFRPTCACIGTHADRRGGGRSQTYWLCLSCGCKYITDSRTGETHRLPCLEEFFAASRRLLSRN